MNPFLILLSFGLHRVSFRDMNGSLFGSFESDDNVVGGPKGFVQY